MLILIGPSASGKTEVAKLLAKKYNITKIVTYTTRSPRTHEVDGIDYNFVTIEEFAKLTDENFFVETTYYNSNYYGTAKKDIKDDKCVILDPNGLKSFLALNDERIVSIFLNCDEKVRYERMIKRQDAVESADQRLVNDRIAFNEANLKGITYIVESDNITLEDLSKKVNDLYINHLGSL
jgi:guanylate kinase